MVLYVWNDHLAARGTSLADTIEDILDRKDYKEFMVLYNAFKTNNYIRLPQYALSEDKNGHYHNLDITIEENFMKITNHEYECG